MRRLVAALVVLVVLVVAVGTVVVITNRDDPATEHVTVGPGEDLGQVADRLCPDNPSALLDALGRANPWARSADLAPGAVLHVPAGGCPPGPAAPGTAAAGPDGGFPVDLAGFPSPSSTGPRTAPTRTIDEDVTTTADGQVIEGVVVNGRIVVRHDDVVIRDVIVRGTGNYAIDIGGTPCASGTVVEFVEIDMANAPANASMPLRQRCPGRLTIDHLELVNSGRDVRIVGGGVTITNSFIYSDRTFPGAHRTALSTHGGDGFVVEHNTFVCVGDGCSSSVNLYSDYAPVTDYLFEDNLLAGGSICLRGGQTHAYGDETREIRIIDNRFSTAFAPECGTHQAIGQFDAAAPGNEASGNVWHESGEPIPGR